MSRRRALNFAALPSLDDDQDDELLPVDDGQERPEPQRAADEGVVSALTGADVSTPLTFTHVPAPYQAREGAELDEQELRDLEACERALAVLSRFQWVAGKALATIAEAKLYRGRGYSTFEDYCESEWSMSRHYAYRLIRSWPVAERIIAHGHDPSERQVRALLAAAKKHGVETAAVAYDAVANEERKVTAAKLEAAAKVLPPRLAGPEQARDVVRIAYRDGRLAPVVERTASGGTDDGEIVDAELVDEQEAQANVDLGRDLRDIADGAERLQRRLGDVETRLGEGVRPVDLGAALSDLSRIRVAGKGLMETKLNL
ncbi:hypothetical protein ACH46L_31625 [Streptomyces althioticus]|uniref:hypothetical protein n=1 Tax=Streptomyces althioticus TaxID=83380 RepID=UPI00379A73FD